MISGGPGPYFFKRKDIFRFIADLFIEDNGATPFSTAFP